MLLSTAFSNVTTI